MNHLSPIFVAYGPQSHDEVLSKYIAYSLPILNIAQLV